MKTIKLVLAVVTAILTTTAFAVERPKLSMVPLSTEKAVVSVVAEGSSNFELSVETLSGEVVYYKNSDQPATGYQQVFDFQFLDKGDYIMNLKTSGTNVSRRFSVNRNGIHVGDSETSYDPYFNFNGELLKLSFLNFEEKKLVIGIYNRNQELLFEKELGNSFAVTTGYNLKNLKKGNYQVVLSTDTDSYSFSFVK